MNQVNIISTKTKLIDRYNTIISQGGSIEFVKLESADILLLSYLSNEKDIKILLKQLITNSNDIIFYNKKIGDFANAVTFGMKAGSKWNGINEVNGGILLVSKLGKFIY